MQRLPWHGFQCKKPPCRRIEGRKGGGGGVTGSSMKTPPDSSSSQTARRVTCGDPSAVKWHRSMSHGIDLCHVTYTNVCAGMRLCRHACAGVLHARLRVSGAVAPDPSARVWCIPECAGLVGGDTLLGGNARGEPSLMQKTLGHRRSASPGVHKGGQTCALPRHLRILWMLPRHLCTACK